MRNSKLRWVAFAVIVVATFAYALWPKPGDPPAANPVKTSLPACVTKGTAASLVGGLVAMCVSDGSNRDASLYFAGPALVNVWATWCAPCQEELPVLSEYSAQPGAIRVVGLAVESEHSTAIDMLTELKVQFPSLLDRDGSVKRAMKVPDALPASYLVDARGNLRMINEPRVFKSVEDVRKAVGQ